MFTDLTREVPDLAETVRGERTGLFAALIDSCCCSSCGCRVRCH
jgi:hypothetical protein